MLYRSMHQAEIWNEHNGFVLTARPFSCPHLHSFSFSTPSICLPLSSFFFYLSSSPSSQFSSTLLPFYVQFSFPACSCPSCFPFFHCRLFPCSSVFSRLFPFISPFLFHILPSPSPHLDPSREGMGEHDTLPVLYRRVGDAFSRRITED